MKNELDRLLEEFEVFCMDDIASGKARSCTLAIKCLCEFLNIASIGEREIETIGNTRDSLRDVNSYTYRQCVDFLQRRSQTSYLANGFINAAVSHFFVFMNHNE